MTGIGFTVVFSLLVVQYVSSKPLQISDDNTKRVSGPPTIHDWIKQFGYPCENHEVQTEDGYLLTYHRIPHGKSGNSTPGTRPPVLVQHGVMADSGVWVTVPDSIGFMLADAGYDVWLGNARGNRYSRKHIKYDPDKNKKQFWDFSWHEMGYYDLPASIDYILNVTEETQLLYAGHSMGTTMYLVLGATRPEYMDKIKASVLMAPVAFLWNVRSPVIRVLAFFTKPLQWLANHLGFYEVFSYSESGLKVTDHICGNSLTAFICEDALFITAGFDKPELDKKLLTTYLQFLPGGSSIKQFEHYGQIAKRGADFKQFDYGILENTRRYDSFFPPSYDLSTVTAPTYIFYSENDWLVHQKDALYTAYMLPNVQNTIKVANELWNHLDYQMGSDVKTLVNDHIIDIFANYTQ